MKTRFIYPFLALLAACSSGSQVGHPSVNGKPIDGWQVVTTAKDQDSGLCYAFSAPVASHGTFTGKRAAPYVMATRRKSGKVEVSVSSGYSFRHASVVELVAGKKSFKLKAKDSVAWAQNDAQDKALLAALQQNDSVQVLGVTSSSQTTKDEYSTTGFSDALERVKALCP